MQEELPLQAEKYFYAKDEKSQLLLIIFIRIRALCQGGDLDEISVFLA